MSDGKCEQCDDSLVVLWAWGSVLCALRKSRTLEIQWMDLLSCCIPRGLLVLIEQLYSCVLLASWSREFHSTVLCVWTYCIYFWWDSPGAWYGIRLLLPDSFVLPNDLKSDSKSICAVHHHLRLWHAHFLVAEHRHYWHDDGRVSGEHFLLLWLVLHPDAGSGQLRLRMPCGKCNGAPLLSECFVLSRWNCLVHAELWSPLALQSGAALTVSRLLAGFTLGCP